MRCPLYDSKMGLIDLFVFRVINSRTAIAGAIIGLLLIFLQFKEFELYWGAVFLRLEEYWRSPFF